jgi:hypothetical protein
MIDKKLSLYLQKSTTFVLSSIQAKHLQSKRKENIIIQIEKEQKNEVESTNKSRLGIGVRNF